MYADGLPADVRLAAKTQDGRLLFVFEASGTDTHFTNGFDPDPRARQIFNLPRPRPSRDCSATPKPIPRRDLAGEGAEAARV